MSKLCHSLHEILNTGKRFNFFDDYQIIPRNGIYILFQKGEQAHNGDRIVRVGTHSSNNNLRSRLKQHFLRENKDQSIFRKNIGRCILNKQQNPYLSTWDIDMSPRKNKEKYSHLVDAEFERKIEKEISAYLRENFTFVILEVPNKEDRLLYESRLISTVSLCNECAPSPNWLGLYSPKEKIRNSGLWLTNELCKQPLTMEELDKIQKWLVK